MIISPLAFAHAVSENGKLAGFNASRTIASGSILAR